MKIVTSKIFLVLLFLCAIAYLKAQHAEDPIMNVYKVGSSAEIFLGYTIPLTGNTYTKQGIWDNQDGLNNIVQKDVSQFAFMDTRKTASGAGDFNGDGLDEVVTVRTHAGGNIVLTIPGIDEDLTIETGDEEEINELLSMTYSRLRICVGNFDRDIEDEFAICYGGPGNTIRLMIFETDKDLLISKVCEYKAIQYYDHLFDITAGDTDGDGIDELAMVKNTAALTEKSSAINPPIFIPTYDLYILKYDTAENEIAELEVSQNLKPEIQANSGDLYYSPSINEMRIACGDLNIDGKDEIVVGWSAYYSYHHYTTGIFNQNHHYQWCDCVFLNTFGYNSETGDIENRQNMHISQTGYGTSNVGTHPVALSLKCEKLDNFGRDEVLVNGSHNFFVLGHGDGDMELEQKESYTSTGVFNVNIRGNEAFVVADLNPDTSKLDFKKEIILLLSDKSAYYQVVNTDDLPTFLILELDTISADTVAFKTPIGPYGLTPSSAIPDRNIEVSAFVAGDFDLKDTDVYMIGTPEVVPVSELQYPLVVLNAPPVHFDILDGVSHDLCDAFIDDANPTFSALYNTKVEDKNTTSVDVNSSIGFSSDFRAYAMAGGSGFESSVTANYDKGKSFYEAKSHSTSIEEEWTVYTEDYVLYSNLDYLYYKYPIYNSLKEKIGDIAILNPESENFSSVWGSGNSWQHPGYSFNHEPGNILSYRPFMNINDFSTRESDFTVCDFSRVPVTNTGNSSFKFNFESFETEENSVSFSSGVGASLFTKVGIETTISVNVGAFGIGGSVQSEVRAGVSAELSGNYSASKLSNHSTELSEAFQIDGQIGRLNENYDNVARYNITPYIYRSQSGALVLDYMVDLDESNKDWWVDNYGQKPDLAFILPWRYAVEKGSDHLKPSKLQKTNEIQFYPPVVAPGDTVCITARVHNYSLQTFENNLKLTYYLGDPENGGVKLTDIDGQSESSKYSTMIYYATEANLDFEDYLTFLWQVPDTVSCSPRIYAVIDEGDEYSEIHEDNNTGWNTLNITECSECLYAENYIGIEDKAADVFQLETYPTPVSAYSRIRFSLPFADDVRIEVYSISGQKIATVTDAHFPAGDQEVEFYAGGLSDGLYFYRFTAGSRIGTTKLIVMKQ